MANSDHIMNEKDFSIPEGWSEVTRPPVEGGGAQVPPVAVDRFASGAISSMTLGLNTDVAGSQMGGNVPNFRIQPPQPSAIAAVNASVQSFTEVVSSSSSSGAAGITSVGLTLPGEFAVSGSPVTPPGGTLAASWNPELTGEVFGVPAAGSNVGGVWDKVGIGKGVGTTISVTGNATTAGEAVLFFMSPGGAGSSVAPVPSGAGWSAIDVGTPQGSVYTRNQADTSLLTATASFTPSLYWTGVLGFFGTSSSLATVQNLAVTSGGFANNNTVTRSFVSSVTVGHMVVIFLHAGTTSFTHTTNFSATDNLGNIYTPIASVTSGDYTTSTYSEMIVLAAFVTTGGPCTLTVILDISPGGITIGATTVTAYEISGVSQVSPIPRFVPIVNVLGAVNLATTGPGGVQGILPISEGGTGNNLTAFGGTSVVVFQPSVGGAFSPRRLDYPDIAGALVATEYAGRTLAAAGLASIEGAVDLTSANTNVTLSTLSSNPPKGLMRISVYIIVQVPGGAGGTLPDTQIQYFDQDSGALITINATPGNTGNTTSTFQQVTLVINPLATSTIKYAIGQVTPITGGLSYAYHARAEYLG